MDLLKTEHYIGRLTPNLHGLNAALIAPHFYRRFGRLPRSPSHPKADYHDFIVDRMIRSNSWTSLHLRCVDKETAKGVAKELCPAVAISRTVDVIPTPRGTSKGYVRCRLAALANKNLVAKPTHGSGAVAFLDRLQKSDLDALFAATRYNHFYSFRETQYHPLPSKIIVEDDLSGGTDDLRDYKFFCAGGEILFVQIDFTRFSDHRRVLLLPPHFERADVQLGAFEAPDNWKLPASFEAMREVRSNLGSTVRLCGESICTK